MLGTAKPSGVIFFGTKGRRPELFSYPSTEINLPFKTKDLRWSMKKHREAKTRKRAVRSKKNPYGFAGKTVFSRQVTGGTVNNGLPGQTVKEGTAIRKKEVVSAMPKLRMMTIAIPPTFGTSLFWFAIISRIADDYGKPE